LRLRLSTRYNFGPFTLDLDDRTVFREGRPVSLPPKVFDTLAVLVQRSGRVVSKEELMRAVWPDTFVEESNLTQNIFVLRRALADDDGRTYIETVPRRGYRFAAAAEPVTEETVVVQSRESIRIVTEEEVVSAPATATRSVVLAWTAAVMLALVAIASLVALARRPPDRLDRMELRKLTLSGNAGDAAISPDGRFAAYVAHEDRGDAIRLRQLATSRDVPIVVANGEAFSGLTFSPDGEFLFYLSDASLHQVSTLGGNARRLLSGVRSPISFAPDRRQFAFVRWTPESGEQELMIASLDGAAPRRLAARRRPAVMSSQGPGWSPDGEKIAVVVNTSHDSPAAQLIEVAVRNGAERIIANEVGFNAGKAVWLPDGSAIVVETHQLWLFSYPDGARQRITNDASRYSAISLSADGKRILAVQSNHTTELRVAPHDELSRGTTIFGSSGRNNAVSWFPDGKRLATLAHDEGNPDVWSMQRDGSDPRQLTFAPALDNYPSVCGDSSIVFASNRDGISEVWRMDADGRNQRALTRDDSAYGIDCARDGKWFAFHRADPSLSWVVWRMDIDGRNGRALTSRPATFPVISPDGKWIACNYKPANEWQLALISVDDPRNVRVLEVPGLPTRRLIWTPDGRALLFARERGRGDELVRVAVEGGEPQPIADFETTRLLALAFSPDGAHAALVRSTRLSDVVVIGNFR
jgi:eukaryotic-like serine/threonine-protein kinase